MAAEEDEKTRLRNYTVAWCLAQICLHWKFGSLSNHGPWEYLQVGLVLATLGVDSRGLTAVTFLARTAVPKSNSIFHPSLDFISLFG